MKHRVSLFFLDFWGPYVAVSELELKLPKLGCTWGEASVSARDGAQGLHTLGKN